jgi:succinate dehydrogenase/fumarate reductase flavoprotein subunit
MESGAGVYREEDPTREACRAIAQLKGRFADVGLEDASRVFNTELVAALELANLLDVGEAIAHSALYRRESRGAHTRRDHPKRDDAQFLHHTVVHFDAVGPRLSTKPVTITRWQPEERKY